MFSKLKLRPFDTRFKQYYNKYRNILNVLIRKAKQLFYQGKLLRARSDGKQVWNIINEVIGKSIKNKTCDINKITMKNGCNTESKTEICNTLN